MAIDRQTWTRICRLFDELVALPPAERRRALAERCAQEEDIVGRELERMLAADERVDSGLDQPLAHMPGLEGPPADAPGLGAGDRGDRIGGFVLEKILGEGGMATVWLARQASPPRPVALKLLRGLHLSRSALARFRYETEVLARLRHPAIARLYEAGTHWRRVGEEWLELPYLAMEHVSGASDLFTYARDRELDLPAGLALFREVLGAVAHAHRSGILHRDLKTQNLLVDTDGNPKVIDFGIARPAAGRAELEPLTRAGQLVGTLASMSPEQLRGDPAVDVRADVYSLGCVLFELLEGRPPFDLEPGSLADALEQLCEGRRAAMQRTPRELQWIVARAMAPERERRYASVDELAEDLRRFELREPLRAGPPGRAYAARKFVQRHGVLVSSALAVVASLTLGLVASELGRGRAERAEAAERTMRERAEESERVALAAADRVHRASLRTRALHDFFVGMIENTAGPGTTVLAMLDEARRRLESDSRTDPLLRAGIRATLAKAYEDLFQHGVARELLEPAIAYVREHGTPGDITWVQVHLDWMKLLVLDQRYAEVLEVCDLLEPWIANDHGVLFEPQVHANLVARRAAIHYFLGDLEAARAGFEESLALYEANGITDDPYYWVSLQNLGSCRLALHDYDGALECLERRLAEPGISARRKADTLGEIALARGRLGQHREAVLILDEVLELYGPADEALPLRVGALAQLGEQLVLLGDPSAEEVLVEVIERAPGVTEPPYHVERARSSGRAARHLLARLAFERGDRGGAREATDALIADYLAQALPRDATWFDVRLLQARCLEADGRTTEAARLLREQVDWEAAAGLDPLRRGAMAAVCDRLGVATDGLAGR